MQLDFSRPREGGDPYPGALKDVRLRNSVAALQYGSPPARGRPTESYSSFSPGSYSVSLPSRSMQISAVQGSISEPQRLSR